MHHYVGAELAGATEDKLAGALKPSFTIF